MKKQAWIGYGMLAAIVFLMGCGETYQQADMAKRVAPVPMAPAAGMVTGAVMAEAARQDFNTEDYDVIEETGFQSPLAAPLSTFSIDVDTASYANIRRFLTAEHQLPPKDAVRIEEMVNYFRYAYPQPTGPEPFSVTLETRVCPWKSAHRLAMIGLKAKDVATGDLPPMNLVFLLDVSGSMDAPDKLPLLQKSFRLLVDRLRDNDRVAIVVYAGAAGRVLPPTSGRDKRAILEALDRLSAGGSTAGAQGIHLAYQTAREAFIPGANNRVILATDGDFNVGVSSDAELVRIIEDKRKEGIYLTVLGFGTGNLKDARMEKLADKGNGNYAYIDSLLEAKKVLVREMGATLLTVAEDVKIQVEFNPAKVRAYRLIGYENRRLAAEDFNDDRKDAGEIGAGHTVTALYEIVPAGSDETIPGVDPLKYQTTTVSDAARASSEMMTAKLRYKEPGSGKSLLITRTAGADAGDFASASEDFRFAAAVAGFGLVLRASEHKGDLTWDQVLNTARSARGGDPEGDRAEMISLVEQASLLAK